MFDDALEIYRTGSYLSSINSMNDRYFIEPKFTDPVVTVPVVKLSYDYSKTLHKDKYFDSERCANLPLEERFKVIDNKYEILEAKFPRLSKTLEVIEEGEEPLEDELMLSEASLTYPKLIPPITNQYYAKKKVVEVTGRHYESLSTASSPCSTISESSLIFDLEVELDPNKKRKKVKINGRSLMFSAITPDSTPGNTPDNTPKLLREVKNNKTKEISLNMPPLVLA